MSDNRDAPQSRGKLDLQDELGDIVELWMEYHRNQEELSERAGIFLRLLEGGCAEKEEAYRRIEALNWRRTDDLQFYVFRQETADMSLSHALDYKLEQLGNIYTAHYEGNLVLILNRSMTDVASFERELGMILEGLNHFCGRSPEFSDIFQLKVYYELARVADDYAPDGKARIRDIESALISYYFSLIAENTSIGLTHPVLKRLKEYDTAYRSQLHRTLEVYLRCERNNVKAARALFIHRNTLLYRIDKIVKLTGLDLDSPEVRLHILMSYRLKRFADRRAFAGKL